MIEAKQEPAEERKSYFGIKIYKVHNLRGWHTRTETDRTAVTVQQGKSSDNLAQPEHKHEYLVVFGHVWYWFGNFGRTWVSFFTLPSLPTIPRKTLLLQYPGLGCFHLLSCDIRADKISYGPDHSPGKSLTSYYRRCARQVAECIGIPLVRGSVLSVVEWWLIYATQIPICAPRVGPTRTL